MIGTPRRSQSRADHFKDCRHSPRDILFSPSPIRCRKSCMRIHDTCISCGYRGYVYRVHVYHTTISVPFILLLLNIPNTLSPNSYTDASLKCLCCTRIIFTTIDRTDWTLTKRMKEKTVYDRWKWKRGLTGNNFFVSFWNISERNENLGLPRILYILRSCRS